MPETTIEPVWWCSYCECEISHQSLIYAVCHKDCGERASTATRQPVQSRPFDPTEFGFVIYHHEKSPTGIGAVGFRRPDGWWMTLYELEGEVKALIGLGETTVYDAYKPNSAASARIILRHLGVEGV